MCTVAFSASIYQTVYINFALFNSCRPIRGRLTLVRRLSARLWGGRSPWPTKGHSAQSTSSSKWMAARREQLPRRLHHSGGWWGNGGVFFHSSWHLKRCTTNSLQYLVLIDGNISWCFLGAKNRICALRLKL